MEYLLTFGIGVGIIVIVSALVYCAGRLVRGVKRSRRQYDERQQRARGIAYRNACCALELFLFFWFILEVTEIPSPPTIVLLVLAVILGAAVFGVSCILLDAYIGLKESPRRAALLLALCTVADLLCAWTKASHEGMDSEWWLYLMMGAALGAMLAALGIKALLRRREDAEE